MSTKELVKTIFHRLIIGNKPRGYIKVLTGPAKGSLLNLDLRKEGSYWLGTYDSWILDRVPLNRLVMPGDTAWDCGAYVGYYTAIFRNLVGTSGQVVSVEASSINYRNLAGVALENKWENVDFLNLAIGPENSTIDFAGSELGSAGPIGLIEGSRSAIKAGIEQVRCYGVDELISEKNVSIPNFIKFDLETGEIFALSNGADLFGTYRPIILLELHGTEALAAALAFSKNFDYRIADVYSLPLYKRDRRYDDNSFWLSEYSRLAEMFISSPPNEAPHMTLLIPNK